MLLRTVLFLILSLAARDAMRQLTYASIPLHYRRADGDGPAQRSITDRWGTWSLVFPHGERMVR